MVLTRFTTEDKDYCDAIRQHYVHCWATDYDILRFDKGPIQDLPGEFRVLRFAPHGKRQMWTYATSCMSQPGDLGPLEVHIFAPERDDESIAELLVAISHFHRTSEWLGLGHSVNFGRPWWKGSSCDHGLLSLPYLDGPNLEWLQQSKARIRFLWLIPVTSSEINFKRMNGLEALEHKFEASKFDYLNPLRPAVA